MCASALGCAAGGGEMPLDPIDLGDFPATGKADAPVVVEVPFEVGPSAFGVPGESLLTFRSWGRLTVRTHQDRDLSWERLQLVAEGEDSRRRSWRGRSPYVTVAADPAAGGQDYTLTILNWGDLPAYGTLEVMTEASPDAGVEVVFNSPDCAGCADPAGDLRSAVFDVIQGAHASLDVAVYGINDPAILDALCNAAEDGIDVTVFTDETSEDPTNSRGYYASLFGTQAGLVHCGVKVEAVRSYGLMHHKFMVADPGTDDAVLLTGSTNFTTAGFEENHNNVVIVRGVPQLIESYRGELGQFTRHCATGRLEERTWCDECSPACTENHSLDGAFGLPGGESIEALFSPNDDAMRALRGATEKVYLRAPDPACAADDASCVCRISGSRYVCEYCAVGADGWGLLGEARDRISMSMYSATDSCFALGLIRAQERGVTVRTVWDYVKSSSRYSRDDYLCAAGVETWISNWGGRSPLIRNHNKTVVIDDTLFTGSMNLSASGSIKNNENSLVIRGHEVADVFADYIDREIELLQELGVEERTPSACLCTDLVDNDGDGLTDDQDPDCDGAGPASASH